MDILKHPVGIAGLLIMIGALGWISFVGPGGGLSSDGRETLSDGYGWTAYCEELRRANFDFDADGEIRPVGYGGQLYPRNQAAFDRMVEADCDPRKAPRGFFPGIKISGR